MAIIRGTLFSEVYESFLSKITDDMYMQLTPEDTYQLLRELLLSSIHKFEFPRQSLNYELIKIRKKDDSIVLNWSFINKLTYQEINILSNYMIVEWLGQQLASIQNVRMKYSGSDFKFTSQANHMQKLLQIKKDYERQGFHLQRLYKRRKLDENGIYRSTFSSLMSKPVYSNENTVGKDGSLRNRTTVENLYLVKGDSFTFDIILSELENYENVNSIFFSVKKTKIDQNYTFQKSLTNGIISIDTLKYRVCIEPQDSELLECGEYYYDLEIGINNDIYTIMMGILHITEDITKKD